MGQNVHDPALKGLSTIDKSYLIAMAQDDGPSSTSEIARRLNVDVGYGSVYRQRLIDQGFIHPAGHGYVAFTLPYLADYLTAADALQALDPGDPR